MISAVKGVAGLVVLALTVFFFMVIVAPIIITLGLTEYGGEFFDAFMASEGSE